MLTTKYFRLMHIMINNSYQWDSMLSICEVSNILYSKIIVCTLIYFTSQRALKVEFTYNKLSVHWYTW